MSSPWCMTVCVICGWSVSALLDDELFGDIDWPAPSPGLIPIQHLWDITYCRIHHHHVPTETVQELTDVLIQVLEEIPQDSIHHKEDWAIWPVMSCDLIFSLWFLIQYWNISYMEIWEVSFRCSLHFFFHFVFLSIKYAGERHLTAKHPPLQQDVTDLSHHPRSPLLSMQVIVSSYTWPPPPIPSTIYSAGNQAFLTFSKGWKTKDLCLLIRLDSVPYLNENWKCSCVAERGKMVCRTGILISTFNERPWSSCSICPCPKEKWPPSQHVCYLMSVWHEMISTSCLLNMYMWPINDES